MEVVDTKTALLVSCRMLLVLELGAFQWGWSAVNQYIGAQTNTQRRKQGAAILIDVFICIVVWLTSRIVSAEGRVCGKISVPKGIICKN